MISDIIKEVWHSLSVDDVLKRLEVDISIGLSSDVVKERRGRFGLNQITPKKGTPFGCSFY